MAESIQAQIKKLRASIAGLEAQRSVLGEAIIEPALAALRSQLLNLEEQARAQTAPVEERRLVTILFMDMVGSTGMAEKLDPEEWRQVVATVHSSLGAAIVAQHGSVAQYLGDGVLAFFGAKQASENDPENAIRAALEGQAAVAGLPLKGKTQLRAGIHSGLVVVGELGEATHKEFTASGDAMNLAARLQAAAPPGGILISHDTYRYVRGVFDLTPRPPLTVKGKSEPIQTYLVRRAKPRPFRSLARGVAGIETRTIGREAAIHALQEAYLRAYEGHGVVWAQLLSEPGVGKSRLVADMNDWIDLREETTRLLRARAFPDDANQPFALVRRLWFDRFQIAEDTPLEQAQARWVERFKEFSRLEECEEAAHALGLLVGLPFSDSPHIGAMRNDPMQVKGRALVVSRELFQAVRQQYPVVVLLEDLQWTDAASWEYLVEVFLVGAPGDQTNGLFILGTARPEWHPPQELLALFEYREEIASQEKLAMTGGEEIASQKKLAMTGGEEIASQEKLAMTGGEEIALQDKLAMTGGEEIASQKTLAMTDREEIDSQNQPGMTEDRLWGILIQLAPLSEPAMRALAQELLQRTAGPPEQLIDLLVQRAEGVPYYAEEMVNWLIDHAILDTRAECWQFLPERLKEQPLPATLQHLLLTRLSSLSHDERAALQRGAIFGRRFWTGGVEALGVPDGAETFGHLQPRGFVELQPEPTFQGEAEWSFHQSLLQEVTYESVLKRERAALHKVAAGWLEKQARQAGRLDEFAGLLGDHCERAGELSSAADWYLLAGRRAMVQGAPRQAADFFTRALDLLPPVDRQRRWQALLGREGANSVLTEANAWRADLDAMLKLAEAIGDENLLAEAYLRLSIFGMNTGELEIIQQAAEQAQVIAQRCGNECIEIKALSILTTFDINRGDKEAARRKIEEALRRVRRLEDENLLSFIIFRAAYCYGEFGDVAHSDTLYQEQIALDHRLGNRAQEAVGFTNIGAQLLGMGMYKQARLAIEQATQICRSLGAHRSLAYNLMNLSEIYILSGDLRLARQMVEEALQELVPSQDARGKSMGLDLLGRVLLAMGDAHGATRRFSGARQLAYEKGSLPLTCQATTGLSACAIQLGQLDEARRYVQEAWEYLKEHGWMGINSPGYVYLSLAETFDALGDDDNVQAVLESGHQAIQEVAGTINVPEWRQSFIENVPEHRTVKEWWERLNREKR